MNKKLSMIGVLCLLLAVAGSAQLLKTPAEKANYQEGGTKYEKLMDFVTTLEGQSELMNVKKITETLMGQSSCF
jgi:hypothetical protein